MQKILKKKIIIKIIIEKNHISLVLFLNKIGIIIRFGKIIQNKLSFLVKIFFSVFFSKNPVIKSLKVKIEEIIIPIFTKKYAKSIIILYFTNIISVKCQ